MGTRTTTTRLFLFTRAFPYQGEYSFLEPELPHLAGVFDQVTLVPQQREGPPRPLPAGIEVDDAYAAVRAGATRAQRWSLALRLLPHAVTLVPTPGSLIRQDAVRHLYRMLAEAGMLGVWLRQGLREGRIPREGAVFYTYWMYRQALGLALHRELLGDCRLVSRAHGFDLYQDTHPSGYIPGQAVMLATLDRVFAASDAGRRHLRERYPAQAGKVETARLGTRDPKVMNRPSQDGVIRLVSCSHLVAVKRVGLMAAGIAHAARLRPDRQIGWTHLGDGPCRDQVERVLRQQSIGNLRWSMPGALTNEAVVRFLGENPADLFLNTSASEGLPVALQEAASFGIPLLATAVGGNPEIVSGRNGRLLPSDPSPSDIGTAIADLARDGSPLRAMRQESRTTWEGHFDARRNHAAFARKLAELAEVAP